MDLESPDSPELDEEKDDPTLKEEVRPGTSGTISFRHRNGGTKCPRVTGGSGRIYVRNDREGSNNIPLSGIGCSCGL